MEALGCNELESNVDFKKDGIKTQFFAGSGLFDLREGI